MTAKTAELTLVLTEEERAEVLRLLEQDFVETHVEARRTEGAAYQQQLHRREAVVRGLLERVRSV